MELDAKTKLRRFCYLGSLDPVYVHHRGSVRVKEFWPALQGICKALDDESFLLIIKEVLSQTNLLRRDEPLFAYAVYLATDVDDKWKHAVRIACPACVRTDDDLFLFCKYAMQIQKEQNHSGFSKTVRKAITAWYETQTPDAIRNMWVEHRGAHGFTHKAIIKLCHISDDVIGATGVISPFFKTCTELIKETEGEGVASTKITDLAAAPVLSISKLRTTKSKDEALKIIRKLKLHYNQVPGHLLRYAPIMETLIPGMSYLQLLKCWRHLARYNHFENPKILKVCQALLDNKKLLRKDNIHPIVMLLQMDKLGIRGDLSKLAPKKVKVMRMSYFKDLYAQSFGHNQGTGLRMHITINLQNNYKKKLLNNYKKLSYCEAAVALAFGYYKKESIVDVFHWVEDKIKLEQIPWTKEMDIEAAETCCENIQNAKNCQRLVTPVLQALSLKQIYDVFVVIVPSAGRGNPKQNSEFLCKFLDKYRAVKNSRAKFVIVNLRKFKRSMAYSTERNENILEICGLDEHTTDLICNFALNRFA